MPKRKGNKMISRIWKSLFKIIIFLLCLTFVQVAALKFIDPPFTPNLVWGWVESVVKGDPEKYPEYHWKNIEQISPHLRRAVLAAEDQRFMAHSGFDFNEIKKILAGVAKGKKIRGASTISMQTARSVFLLSSRSLFRKLAEIYYTLLVELLWDKHRILEMYLNTVDWGTGVIGAEAAARKYFSKSALNLTRDEAALMTAILPSPHRWSIRNPSPYLKMRQAQISKQMHMMPLL